MRPELNACGFSTETTAAEYETDAALAEAGMDMADEGRAETRVKHSGPNAKFCVLCLSGEHERVDEVPR